MLDFLNKLCRDPEATETSGAKTEETKPDESPEKEPDSEETPPEEKEAKPGEGKPEPETDTDEDDLMDDEEAEDDESETPSELTERLDRIEKALETIAGSDGKKAEDAADILKELEELTPGEFDDHDELSAKLKKALVLIGKHIRQVQQERAQEKAKAHAQQAQAAFDKIAAKAMKTFALKPSERNRLNERVGNRLRRYGYGQEDEVPLALMVSTVEAVAAKMANRKPKTDDPRPAAGGKPVDKTGQSEIDAIPEGTPQEIMAHFKKKKWVT